MQYLIVILLGYLLGSSNMAYWISLYKKVDIRGNGTGNLGASNATVLLGWGAGVIVALHDGGKAFLSVLLAKALFPNVEYAGVVAGVACVLGHIYPFYLKFKGGKGLASLVGVAIALDWRVALAVFVLLIAVTLITDFIALGTISVSIATPLGLWLTTHNWMIPLILCIATVVMIFKHMDNIKRICNKTEIGLLSTIKGENRVK